MNRRTTLRTLMMATAGMVALPAWAREWSANAMELPVGGSFFSAEESATLKAVTDTIIPAGEEGTIGALVVEVDLFLAKLFADCYEPEVQLNIKRFLTTVAAQAELTYIRPFEVCDQSEREDLLLAIGTSEIAENTAAFALIKSETIRGFLTSRKVLRDYFDYVVAPGYFYGCVDLNNS